MISFEDACVSSSVGTALLAQLEALERDDITWLGMPSDSILAAIGAAVGVVESMPFGELCSVAVHASTWTVIPLTARAGLDHLHLMGLDRNTTTVSIRGELKPPRRYVAPALLKPADGRQGHGE